MIQTFTSQHRLIDTPDGPAPDGGVSFIPIGSSDLEGGRAAWICWQRGPLGRPPGRNEPNGAFVATIIAIAIDRLEFYQRTRFGCAENAAAIGALQSALKALEARWQSREERGVEGTHEDER